MAHSLSQVYIHLVLVAQDRAPVLADKAVRQDWHGYLAGICKNMDCPSLRIGGSEDHVHIFCRFSREQTVDRLTRELKRGSAGWLRIRHRISEFRWRDGYGGFSVSQQNVDGVIRYIQNQDEHHRTETFEDEYRRIRRRCGGSDDQVNVHFVFSTKNRFPYLTDVTVRRALHDRIQELLTDMGCEGLRVGGTEDHVHAICRFSRQKMLGRVVREVKKSGMRWLGTHFGMWHFGWQTGYGAFSVSPQHVEMLARYIENQEEHHRLDRFHEEHPR